MIKHQVSFQSREVIEIHVKNGNVCQHERMCCEQPVKQDCITSAAFPNDCAWGTSQWSYPNVPLLQQGKCAMVQITLLRETLRVTYISPKGNKIYLIFSWGKKKIIILYETSIFLHLTVFKYM